MQTFVSNLKVSSQSRKQFKLKTLTLWQTHGVSSSMKHPYSSCFTALK